MSSNNKLERALEIILSENVTVKFYVITRHLKDGVTRSAKILDKYNFRARTVDVSAELNDHFVDIAKNQINDMIAQANYVFEEYAIIGDELEDKIYTYALNNAKSFSDVILNQMLSDKCPSIHNLSEVREDLWAYSIRFSVKGKTVFTFRKTSRGKVATDQARNVSERISALFDVRDAQLKVVESELISFDNKVDCLYIDNEFVIFRKTGFEQIVGLEDEFKELAEKVIDIIAKNNLVEGIESLSSEIYNSRSLLKTIANISKRKTHEKLGADEITKMIDTLDRVGEKKAKYIVNGKISIEDIEDLKGFLKLLNDYYKEGMVSGNFYGTNSGRVIDPNKKN